VLADLAGSCDESSGIVLVGEWKAVPISALRLTSADSVEIVRCEAKPRVLQGLLRNFDTAAWLLVGGDQNDDAIDALVRSMRTIRPGCSLAMLGSRHDWPRCERWLRRGCKVYLELTSDIGRVLATLVFARSHGIMAVDTCFLEEVRRQIPLGDSELLTKREKEVLLLLRDGLPNRDIATALQVSENTIEFHIANLLDKLSARNRLGAVERARALGI
jgi:DNA-binding NarL/FixJ family response regulator